MISGVLSIDANLGSSIDIELSDGFFGIFVVEVILGIRNSETDYNKLLNTLEITGVEMLGETPTSPDDAPDSVLGALMERLTDFYFEGSEKTYVDDENIKGFPKFDLDWSDIFNKLFNLHMELFSSLVANNSYTELHNIAAVAQPSLFTDQGTYSVEMVKSGSKLVYKVWNQNSLTNLL